MGWFFRKSIKLGPMRLNLSKSGLGVSAGVRGARVSVGPRGAYLNVGRGGVYYRQKLGVSGRAGASRHSAPQIPQSIVENMSSYPQFPQHGLPRIAHTLFILFAVALLGLLIWLPIYFSSLSKTPPKAPAATAAPANYRLLQSYSRDGRMLQNVLIQPKLERDKLVQLAKFLHANDRGADFRLFDDEAQFQKFMDWDVNRPSKLHPYPKAWADKHYIGDISRRNIPGRQAAEWQLTDQTGKIISTLE
jgi:hypothetical protein